MKNKIENITIVAWVTSLIATLGSLYFSEIRLYEPCTLCWYQRILMYPLVLILAIGILRKDASVAIYSAVFSFVGFCLASYHYAIQKISFFAETAPSCGRVPCTGQYINWFGFVTIPFLALTAFAIIFVCSILIIRRMKGDLK
ncbi:disulfide oxidoreductase [Halalkalibacter akibai]|uniref:Probable disulfide formation protein n=1 Tax=Halalkalibacter akibai (strain ATCC 43226 / DSM 21942 / CIP 109018 / JCM 9157 / 1139) TaxID=1236973 RepID=W4QS94_HALA3|nr:disulfide oxidoreductase [Halalkalibacter akibai]GAE34493.1 putative disulfide oxidoreductase [Halalkalibacter akibai JCM 9157]